MIEEEAGMLLGKEPSITEQEGEEEIPTSDGLVDINAGPEEVLNKVPKLLKDPKLGEIIRSGLTDAAGPDDEKIEIKPSTRIAAKLNPTQSQIGTGQSLNDQAGDKWGNLDRAIKGGKLASPGGEFPILVFKDFVLDGHHRWSQFVTTNPGATVDVVEVNAPGVNNEKTALALLHYMNFALFGKSPTKDFKGENVYDLDAEKIKQEALDNMADTTPDKLFKAKLIATPTPEAAANHFAGNLSDLNGPGKFPRLVMPQPGDAGSEDGFATTPDTAAAGAVNYLNPVPTDLKESKNLLTISKKRLQEIIKEELENRKR